MADKKQTKVYLIPENETRDSHTYHYTAIKTRKFTLENKKMREDMGKYGKLRANENYAWDKKVIEYLDASN